MLAIIADDFSGAGDSGLQFAKRRLKTVVVTRRREEAVAADVVVFDTDSRAASTDEAGARVSAAVDLARRWGASTLYKKIDSTIRGNLGAEIDALVTAGGYELAVVCPSFPATGRTVNWAKLYVRGLELAETEFAADPIWPATESLVYAAIGRQSRLHVAAVPLEIVRRGDDSLAATLGRAVACGVRVAVVDAETRDDLDTIAHAVARSAGRWVAVGSAGLAEALGEDLTSWIPALAGKGKPTETRAGARPDVRLSSSAVRRERTRESSAGPALVVVGSVNPRSVAQARCLASSGRTELVVVTPRDLLDASAADSAVAKLVAALQNGRSAALWLDSSGEEIGAWLRGVHAVGDAATASRDLVGRLASIAASALARSIAAGVVATGGDTALAICDRLACSATEVHGEVRPAIPIGVMLDGALAGRCIVTKAGGFGDDDALIAAVEAIERPTGH